MRASIPLGRVLGFPVGLSPSWFIAFAFVTALLALRVYPLALPFQASHLYWTMAALSGLLLFASVLVHELAHSVVARAFGIPVLGIRLFLLGGVSQITREASKARDEFLVAFVGPATSFVLAGLALGAWAAIGAGHRPITVVMEWLWLMNAGLGLFNLMPGLPLDGGRLLRAVLWGVSGSYFWATRLAAWAGRAVAWGLIGLGLLSVLGPGYGRWRVDPLSGLTFIVIGGFLEVAARSAWGQARDFLLLRSAPVSQVLERDWPRVAPWARLRAIEEEGILAEDGDHLLVVDEGTVVGIIPGTAALESLAAQPGAPASEVMRPAAEFTALRVDGTAFDAWERMTATGCDLLPVVDGNGRFLGLVLQQRLLRFVEQRR
ncbi:MAG: CBS domain-containing protein [Dehalococcoidia bacterium]|nr:CBS domain-containing protein [Dehalococcoidia bacterium]